MNNTENKNLFQNLDGIKAVEELSDKAAATCAGGGVSVSSSNNSSSSSSGDGWTYNRNSSFSQIKWWSN